MITLQQFADAWNRFFFEPIPVHSLALFRILFGCVLLYNAFFILADMEAYLGPRGLVRYNSCLKRSYGKVFSLFFYLPPTMRSVRLIVWLHVVSVMMMTVGLLTSISTLLAFITLRSIVNRNPEICNGGDNVAKIMCFLLIFAPAGRVYSLDAAFFGVPDSSPSLLYEPWALRLMQIQVAIVYLSTAYWKLSGATYRNGTAAYYAANNQMYKRFAIPALLLRKPFVQALTWGTLTVEFALGSLIWFADLRSGVVAMGIALHLAIEYSMNVHLFGWYMIACLLLFLDPAQIMNLAS